MRLLTENYAAGSGSPASRLLSSVVSIVAGLGADRGSIPANGATFATLNYAGLEATPHVWTVNGATVSVPASRDVPSGLMMSEVEVTATQVGPIEISVNGTAMTIDAV